MKLINIKELYLRIKVLNEELIKSKKIKKFLKYKRNSI